MIPDANSDAAQRLCAACGMCCNGVMFTAMQLQPTDSARQLTALGLKVKRRKSGEHCPQPCPALTTTGCSIYAARPARCRMFDCRQLLELAAGRIKENDALARIEEAQALVLQVRERFLAAGEDRENKAFATRYAAVFTEPWDDTPEAIRHRELVKEAMQALEMFLTLHFRTEPASGSTF